MIKKYLLLFALYLLTASAFAAKRPNILWITSEDNSIRWIGCYGAKNNATPNIDQLAKEGFRYTHCFDNGAVCAPTRSAWITGMHAISNGTQPMRSGYSIPESIRYYNEQLQQAGYYTGNWTKTDYNLRGRSPTEAWDTKKQFGWQDRKPGQPFFHITNIGDSHESRAFGNLREGSQNPAKMVLASYHPDIPEMRETYAIYAGAVEKMDAKVGEILAQLRADGLDDDTIVIYCSDHGGVLARSKRFLYADGIHCPLIVRIPEKWKSMFPEGKTPGSTIDRLVSFIDMPKTWVSLAGGEIAKNFQGTIFLGEDVEPEPAHHFAWRSRADDRYDCVRVMRDKQFAYHKNYMPFVPNGQFLAYLHNMKGTGAWEKHHRAGKTDAVTGRFFEPRVSEEFYDNVADFDNVNNLIDAPKHRKKIAALKAELRRQQLHYFDSGLLPEDMRTNRAKEHNLTLYELARNPSLYPLEKYLDAADVSLARDPANLASFIENLSDKDPGLRYWAVVGLLLLDDATAPAIPQLKQALTDDSTEIPALAAWALYKTGEQQIALDYFRQQLKNNPSKMLVNVVDWMGEAAHPLLDEIGRGKILGKGLLSDIIHRAGVPMVDESKANNIQTPHLKTTDGAPGLTGEYFAQKDCKGDVVFTRIDPQIKFSWGNTAPNKLPVNDFSIRWTGKLTSRESGTHLLRIDCDDGARVWVDDTLILNTWIGKRAALIELQAKHAVDLKVEYVEISHQAKVALQWITPSKIPEGLK